MSSNRNAKKIVCVPAFIESNSISDIVQKSKKYATEVIAYDGSKHDTYEITMSAGATVIRNPEYNGDGIAIRSFVPGSKITRFVYINSLFYR